MKILVGFEESQAVTIQLRKLGHEAYSCDLLPCSGKHPKWHIQGDAVKEAYSNKYDMGIFFPPCTDLAVSGSRWFKEKIANGSQQKSIDLFMLIANCPISKIAIENPIGIMSSKYRKPDQIIQPWQFGDLATKTTCLWLKNLPQLVPSKIVEGREARIHKMAPSPDRWKERSRTYEGIAEAMAKQWGDYIEN